MISLNDKIKVDPYLFVLLLHMLYYEVDNELAEKTKLSLHDLGNLIYKRLKRKRIPENELDNIAYNEAEYYRKKIFPFKQNNFLKKDLDLLVRQITLLGRFDSWSSFAHEYGQSYVAKISKEKYCNLNFKNMDKQLRRRIEKWVDTIIDDLDDIRFVHQYDKDHAVILTGEYFTIRTARWEEIIRYFMESRIYSSMMATKESLERLQGIYNMYNNIFYVYVDKYGILGVLVFFPFRENTYNDFVNDKLFDKNINFFSILTPQNLQHVNYFYISVYHSYSKDFDEYLKVCLNRFIQLLPLDEEIRFIALAKSDKCLNLLGDCLFSNTGRFSNTTNFAGANPCSPIYERVLKNKIFMDNAEENV